ncbi:MAG: glutamine synthetase [Candidatus Hydrogenedentota bacterium]
MNRLRQWIADGLVDTVIVAGIDMQGRLYGKRCVADIFLRDMAEGVHTCDCNFGWDVARMLIDGLDFTGWHKGYGDMTIKPDWSTLRHYAWFDKTVLLIGDTVDHHGHPVSVAPRSVLRKQVEKARAMGFEAMMAPEVEFFLFRETLESSRKKDYRDLQPMSEYISDYCVFRSSMDEWIIGQMRRKLTESNVEVESYKAEWGFGQCEMNLRYTHALEMADRHVVYKHAIREIAALNQCQATFMAKWDSKHSGNGSHVHVSLWEGERPAFPGNGPHGMSDTARHFMGGMMHLAKDLQLFCAPTINSYKRYEDLSFAPTTITWGGDNRTTAFRIAGHGNSMRIENRIPGSDACAHLLYGAMLGAGLYGIEHKLEPIGPFVQANAYIETDAPKLNRTLEQTALAMEQSKAARRILGDDVVDHYVRVARWEVEEYNKHVTDWERRRYFELI